MTIDVIKLLVRGDKRTTGEVDRVVNLAMHNPGVIQALFNALTPEDNGLNMRIMDAIEKITRTDPGILARYKTTILTQLTLHTQKEVKWHVAQIIPRLSLSSQERKNIVSLLINNYLIDQSSIVKVNAMQALAEFALMDSALMTKVISIIRQAIQKGTPAMQVRGKKLLQKLTKE